MPVRLSTRQRQALDASGALPPVGTIIAYAPGYYAAGGNGGGWSHVGPSANTVTAVNNHLPANWCVCDGTAPNDADSPIFNSAGRFLPDLTGSRFVMGNTSAGTAGGNLNNTKTLATPELPGHTHPAGTYNAPHNHTGTLFIPPDNALHGHPSVSASGSAATADAPHNHVIFRASATGIPDVLATNFRTMNTSAPDSLTGGSNAPHSHPSVTVFGSAAPANAPHQHPGSTISVATNPSVPITGTSGSQGSGDSFSILPQYVSVFYIMRIK